MKSLEPASSALLSTSCRASLIAHEWASTGKKDETIHEFCLGKNGRWKHLGSIQLREMSQLWNTDFKSWRKTFSSFSRWLKSLKCGKIWRPSLPWLHFFSQKSLKKHLEKWILGLKKYTFQVSVCCWKAWKKFDFWLKKSTLKVQSVQKSQKRQLF